MKVKIVAYTSDEHGAHVPGDVLELNEGEAHEYVKRGWAKHDPELNPKPQPEVKPKAAIIETPEDRMVEHEDASVKRRKKSL